MGCGERKQDPTATHTLSIFSEVRFPADFLALISRRARLWKGPGCTEGLLLIAGGSFIFSRSPCLFLPPEITAASQDLPHPSALPACCGSSARPGRCCPPQGISRDPAARRLQP